jgi:hypothetical protein
MSVVADLLAAARRPTWADKERADFPVLRDMLSLVGRKLSRSAFRQWTSKQRAAAEKWAAATHLRASDNPVHVPPMPACVKRLPEGE